MSAPEAKNRETAGISSAEDVDVGVLFERLRAELRRGVPEGEARGAEFASVRALAERFWPVTAEKPLQRRRGPKGWLAFQVKRVLRKSMRWYVEPALAEQRIVNDALLRLVDDLAQRVDELERERL